jgi:two-component system, NtrC family, response regulator GlrR
VSRRPGESAPKTRRTPPSASPVGDEPRETKLHEGAAGVWAPIVGRFRLLVVDGATGGGPWESSGDVCSIGSGNGNDLQLADETVSGFHCEIRVAEDRVHIVDLGSLNGTVVDGVHVKEAFLRSGSLIRLGASKLRFELADGGNRLLVSDRTSFGELHGMSVPMRVSFALMEKAAGSDATVLLEGETGTGKGQAAEAIHRASARAGKPFVVVDCGAIPANLLESELFGHEKGAFTGAQARHSGAFEDAAGGTIFLDEIGELPLDLQPKLLRALENRHVRALGTSVYRPVDVRIIAATNRDLRGEVNHGRFRADLFFRLSVVRIVMPPVRQRPEDMELLVRKLLRNLGASEASAARFCEPAFVAGLSRSAWPGNVRELRNYLERCLVFEEPMPLGEDHGAGPAVAVSPSLAASATGAAAAVDPSLEYAEARRQATEAFERAYVRELLNAHGGRVSAAARAAGIGRVYLYRLMRRHGFQSDDRG